MSEIKQISLTDIHVPDRLRAVDDDHALAIQTSIVQHGLLNPITLRFTPNGDRKHTLVAGAHRLRAIELLDEPTIDAIIVKADALSAVLLEIEENLFRNDLSTLDRAVFIETYRDVWQRKHGDIRRGGDQTVKLTVCPIDVLQEEAQRGFAQTCADRLGVSKASVERLQRIAVNLPPELKKRLSGTAIADNQSQLLALAKLPEDKRAIAARAIDERGADFGAIMDLIAPKPKPNKQKKVLSQLISGWSKASPATRRTFMEEAGLMPRDGADD
jgi:ParB family chromosome partitioning protein